MARKTAAEENALTPIEQLAVQYFGKCADAARDGADVGDGQPVDVTIRVFGAVNVGQPGEANSPLKPDLVDVLAIVLEHAGSSKDSVTRRLIKRFKELSLDAPPEVDENYRAEAKSLIRMLTRPRKIPQRGRVTAALQHQLVARA